MKELKIKASIENLERVIVFVDEELENNDCPIKLQMQIDVAVEEIFVNIASYAYQPGEGDATISIDILKDPSRVEITFIDSGIEYNPLEKEDPDVTLSAEERQIGGLGIYMVKKSMDDMIYNYSNGQNILKIIKNL
jgi:anti-sigma regulatory factor (Ser/Thr protein kinase)